MSEKKSNSIFDTASRKLNDYTKDTDNTRIKGVISDLYNKLGDCPGKPELSEFFNSIPQGKSKDRSAVVGYAKGFINKLRNICGNKISGTSKTSGTPGTTSDISILDIDSLYKKLERKLNEYSDTLKELESQIDAAKLGNNKIESGKTYDEEFRDLQRKVETLKEEIKAIVSFVQKGSKDTTPFLSNYYKTLIAIQSALVGGIVSDVSSSSFVSGRESEDRLARLAKDITGRIISLKLDVEHDIKGAIKAPTEAPPAKIDFITNMEIRDPAKLKEYLTSSKPYYYFDLPGSLYDMGDKITHTGTGKKGTIERVNPSTPPAPPTYNIKYDDGTPAPDIAETAISPADATPTGIYKKYRDKDVYAKIEAINGAGFLELIKQYTRIKSTLTEEEAFAFENDLCKHVFRLPVGIKSISYKDMVSTETGKTQLGFLAVIHQMHFIGTLLNRQATPIQASINTKNISTEETSATAAKAAAEATKKLKEDKKNDTDAQLQSAKNDFDTKTKAMTSIPMTKESLIQWMRGTNAEAKANRDLEAQFQTIENTLAPLQKEKEESQTKIDELNEKYNKYVEQQKSYLAATTLDYATLKDLQIKMDSLNNEKTLEEKHNTDITASISLIQQNLENIVRDPNTSDIFVARFKDVEMAQKKVKELEAKFIQDEKEFDLATTVYTQADALLTKIKEDKKTQDKIYMVPTFRPVSASDTNTIDTAYQQMFVHKYRYTQLFDLGATVTDVTTDGIDACVKGIFKLVQDPTYSIQTLSKVKARLKGGHIIPKLGETEAEAASKPGTVKTLSKKEISSELKDILSAVNSESSTRLNQLRNAVVQLAIDFLSAYQPSYLTDLGFIKGKMVKEDPGIINKIDSAIQRSVASLRKDPTKTKYDLDIIEQKYAKIKEYINEYVRIK